MSFLRRTINFASWSGLVFAGTMAVAQEVAPVQSEDYAGLPNANADYPYVSRDQDLGDALRVFARNLQIAIVIDEGVTGKIVASDAQTLTRRQYLDELAEEFSFIWYFDGILLNIVDVASFKTEVLSLQNNNGHDVIDLLKQLDIYQPRFLHRADLKNQALMVKGPERYVEVVKKAIEAIERSDRKTVTLLRGTAGEKIVGGPGFDPAAAAETVDPTQ